MKYNENGNVEVFGYMVGVDYMDKINSFRFSLKSDKGGTQSDFLSGKIRFQSITVLADTEGAAYMYDIYTSNPKEYKDWPISVEFKIDDLGIWTAVNVWDFSEADPKNFNLITIKNKYFLEGIKVSEKEKEIINWSEVNARAKRSFGNPHIPEECIQGDYILRKYGIKTRNHGIYNFDYYLDGVPSC